MPNHTPTVTVEIPAESVWRLKAALADSATVWHDHWREVTDGQREDLNADACSYLSRKAWELWELLDSQGM